MEMMSDCGTFSWYLALIGCLNQGNVGAPERFLCVCMFRRLLLRGRPSHDDGVQAGAVEYEIDDFRRMYASKMKSTLKAAENACVSSHLPTTGSKFYKYTFQVGFQSSDEFRERMAKLGRKNALVQHLFYCAPNAQHAALFYLNWAAVQQNGISSVKPKNISMLSEFGVFNDKQHLRKWVLDIDAPVAELHKKKMLQHEGGYTDCEKDFLNGQVVMMGCGIAHTFQKYEVLDKLMHFTILTRHSATKMSWHVTLNALTFYDNWRHCIHILDSELIFQDPILRDMYGFTDKCIKNNSKGQPMQTLLSCKVKDLSTLNPFQFYGIFNGLGQKIHLDGVADEDSVKLLKYCASSMIINDPWCSVFKKVLVLDKEGAQKKKEEKELLPRKRTSRQLPEKNDGDMSLLEPSKTVAQLCSWTSLPEREAWMRRLVSTADSELCFIPAMKRASNLCDSVARLLSTGLCEVLVHALVRNCGPCARYLKHSGKYHVHGSQNNCIVICIRQWSHEVRGEDFRCFVYCMSAKCKSAVPGGGWVELKHCDYTVLKDKLQ